MARVNSPTQNLYALLAEPEPDATRPSKAQAAKRAQGKEETPKERAAARAVENAAKKAERDKQNKVAEEAERLKQAAAEFDDTGFTQQRLQRVKQAKATKRTPEEEQAAQASQKGNKGEGKPKQKKPFNKEGQVGGQVTGEKKEGNKGAKQAGNKPPRFDKHSNNPKTGKKSIASKDGAGKANWGKTPAAQGNSVEATVAAAAGTTVDEWDEVGVTTTTAATTAAAPADAVAPAEDAAPVEGAAAADDEENDANWLTLDSWEVIKAEKQKALDALVGGARGQPRSLTEEEKNNISKFTVLENQKNKKTESAPAPAAAAAAAAKPAANTTARKGERAVAVDEVFRIRPVESHRGRGGRGRGGRGGSRNAEGGEQQNKEAAPATTTSTPPANRGAGRGRGGRGGKKNAPYGEVFPELGSPLKV